MRKGYFKDSNKKTVKAYSHCWGRHKIKNLGNLPQFHTDWLDKIVKGLNKSAKIFEFGSGPGEEALYLQSLGYSVSCSEAALAAVKLLRRQGLSADKIDVLTDKLPDNCKLILGLSVVVHFNPDELRLTCDKVFASLSTGGRFAFSTVEGHIQEWYTDGYGKTRYMSHLPQAELELILENSGFKRVEVDREKINDKVDGLNIIAHK